MQRQLQLVILAHAWALAPLAAVWLWLPSSRGSNFQIDVPRLTVLAGVAALYLLGRTWLTWTGRWPELAQAWPYCDVVLITLALLIIGNAKDALTILYFLPLASAASLLRLSRLIALGAATLGSYFLVVVQTGAGWSVEVVFRLVVIALIASLYGWVIRTVTIYERAAERAEYQTELAREIHDGIQHLLVTLGARLELAGRLVREAPDRAVQILAQERETVVRASDELRYLVRRLRTDRRHADLASALRAQVGALSDRWPFVLEVEVPPTLPRLSPAAEHAMLRVIQESLTNVAKHADASMVEVQIDVAGGALRCTIRDNGVGFEPGDGTGGLQGLRERVAGTGGTLNVNSAPARGTIISAVWPLNSDRIWIRSVS
jgi:signal transduction histidine kinase